jgi:predicted kinase
MNYELIMTTGLPGCGKSTYRKPFAMDFVSSDHFIEEFALATGKTYSEVFSGYAKEAEQLMYAHLGDLLHNDVRRIVWDQTNLNAKTREKKLAKFNEMGGKKYRKIALFFEPDMQLTLARNEERRAFGRAIPQHVLESMYESITAPKKAEGFDYVFHVPVDSQI